MKKLVLILTCLCLFSSANMVFADSFEALGNISLEQKNQLTQIQTVYKQKINELETEIMSYSSKLAQVKFDKDKSAQQINLLAGAYERNIESLKAQKKALEAELDSKYKAVMTDAQYKQYRAQQLSVQNAFSNFLQK